MLYLNIVVVGLLIIQELLLWLIGKYRFIDHAGANESHDWPRVSILVPARNEERHLHACLQSLGSLNYPLGRLQFIIGDDQSRDQTALIIKEWVSQGPI